MSREATPPAANNGSGGNNNNVVQQQIAQQKLLQAIRPGGSLWKQEVGELLTYNFCANYKDEVEDLNDAAGVITGGAGASFLFGGTPGQAAAPFIAATAGVIKGGASIENIVGRVTCKK